MAPFGLQSTDLNNPTPDAGSRANALGLQSTAIPPMAPAAPAPAANPPPPSAPPMPSPQAPPMGQSSPNTTDQSTPSDQTDQTPPDTGNTDATDPQSLIAKGGSPYIRAILEQSRASGPSGDPRMSDDSVLSDYVSKKAPSSMKDFIYYLRQHGATSTQVLNVLGYGDANGAPKTGDGSSDPFANTSAADVVTGAPDTRYSFEQLSKDVGNPQTLPEAVGAGVTAGVKGSVGEAANMLKSVTQMGEHPLAAIWGGLSFLPKLAAGGIEELAARIIDPHLPANKAAPDILGDRKAFTDAVENTGLGSWIRGWVNHDPKEALSGLDQALNLGSKYPLETMGVAEAGVSGLNDALGTDIASPTETIAKTGGNVVDALKNAPKAAGDAAAGVINKVGEKVSPAWKAANDDIKMREDLNQQYTAKKAAPVTTTDLATPDLSDKQFLWEQSKAKNVITKDGRPIGLKETPKENADIASALDRTPGIRDHNGAVVDVPTAAGAVETRIHDMSDQLIQDAKLQTDKGNGPKIKYLQSEAGKAAAKADVADVLTKADGVADESAQFATDTANARGKVATAIQKKFAAELDKADGDPTVAKIQTRKWMDQYARYGSDVARDPRAAAYRLYRGAFQDSIESDMTARGDQYKPVMKEMHNLFKGQEILEDKMPKPMSTEEQFKAPEESKPLNKVPKSPLKRLRSFGIGIGKSALRTGLGVVGGGEILKHMESGINAFTSGE